MTSAADEIRAKHKDAIAQGEANAVEAMKTSEREPAPPRPEPTEPTMDDDDIPDWVKAYGPNRKKPDGPS